MISITERAATVVQQYYAEDPTLAGQGLRVKVVGGGCAGFTHEIYFEDQTTELDETFQSNGVTFYVDPLSLQYLENTEIDYVEESEFAKGFKFSNPNAKGSCGCGSSVSF